MIDIIENIEGNFTFISFLVLLLKLTFIKETFSQIHSWQKTVLHLLYKYNYK